ncbi:hypothetical protein PLESTB_000348800 [Pleodorina starrii]|uniref:Uncharacterized protein n=1 Tax=Pleodorina starrii TaxID=330485 RepID=A0A9W6EYV7_9CHLO|nr:hypothetical protein PLESTB_000348800 [Pleodorina starrii]
MLLGCPLRTHWCGRALTGLNATGGAARLSYSPTADATQWNESRHPESNDLLTSYQRLLQRGALLPDATQAAAVRALQLLQDAVLQREAARRAATEQPGDSGSATSPASPASQPSHTPAMAVRGAYLWGSVGSGKTALMDLFAETTRQRLMAEGPPGAWPAAPAAPQAPAAVVRLSSRQHFHEFMQEVHGRLHGLQEALPRVVARSRQGMLVYRYAEPEEDPLVTVAREWGSRTAVLCLDELHVTDVADAMILSRLFGSLMVGFDTAVLFTSNRPPRDLYKGGLSRKYFEPFVRLVDEQMVVLRVAADMDYRRRAGGKAVAEAQAATTATATAAAPVAEEEAAAEEEGASPASSASPSSSDSGSGSWFVGPGAEEQLRALWQQRVAAEAEAVASAANNRDGGGATGGGGGGGAVAAAAAAGPVEVRLAYGRTLKVPCAAGDAAWFTFSQLCGAKGLRAAIDDGGALAAPDFLALSRRFREFYITQVPQLGPAQRDEARRLVTLLDVAYDNRCRLAVAAEVAPDVLFTPLLAEARRQGVNPRLGLPKSSQVVLTYAAAAAGGSGDGSAAAAAATAAPHTSASEGTSSAFVPAASVTAALHTRLGPSMTHGSALTNTVHPSEFTGSAAAAFPASFAVPLPPLEAPPPDGNKPMHAASADPRLEPPAARVDWHEPQGLKASSPQQQQQQQQQQKQGDLSVPAAVLAEEVLMYHRAASRLAEMCRVVRVVAGVEDGGGAGGGGGGAAAAGSSGGGG